MTDAAEAWARQQVIDTAIAMSTSGLSPGRSGNVSCRWETGMLITPSGMHYEDLLPDDIVYVGAGGEVLPDTRKPSSEWRFHQAVYDTRDDAHAMVHTHSLNATALACAHRMVPAFHYMVAAAGGKDIPLVPYATFGTRQLSDHVTVGLRDRNACLMANHGQVAVGPSLEAALELAHEVETICAQYVKVLQLGEVRLLDDTEMDEVLSRFKTYGQNAGQ